MKKGHAPRQREVIGWREWVGLPDLGIEQIAAKIDTGARTSALHAENQHLFERSGKQWVRFQAPGPKEHPARLIEAPVKSERAIKNTGGVPEPRIIITTLLTLGRHRWHIDISLADRGAMTFDLIIGRTALKGRGILVDPAHSYLSDLRQSPLPHSENVPDPGLPPSERITQ